jgi:hypothetical protein
VILTVMSLVEEISRGSKILGLPVSYR